MTYFGVLALFILPPLTILLLVVPRDIWGRLLHGRGRVNWEPYLVLLAHVLVALIYTTPWDNYLVAQGVWWYDPALVSGIVFGWVPLEEYIFFVLQTLVTGLWLLGLKRYVFRPTRSFTARGGLRASLSFFTAVLWLVSAGILVAGWEPGTYLALILIWALPPVLLQLAFGADILLANWRLLTASILPTTLYLWVVDALAIRSGTWTIDPQQTTGIVIGGLPIEEMLFFFMTNLIIAFGMTLMLSPFSKERLKRGTTRFRERGFNRRGTLQILTLFLWVLAMIATPIAVWVWGEHAFVPMAVMGVILHAFATLTALASGWHLGRILRVGGIVVIFTWVVELIGTLSGFPFGHYTYSENLGLQLAGVPLLIPLAWLMMLPPAWAVSEAILLPMRGRLGKGYRTGFAILAGVVFTAWDFFLDPQMVGRGLWFWENPGGYFGIPWSNFLGWWGTAALLTWLLQPEGLPRMRLMVIYTITWALQTIGLGVFWGQPGPALVGFLGMGVFVLWSWIREGRLWPFFSGRRLDLSVDQSRSRSS